MFSFQGYENLDNLRKTVCEYGPSCLDNGRFVSYTCPLVT